LCVARKEKFQINIKKAIIAWPITVSEKEKEKIESGYILLQYIRMADPGIFIDDIGMYQLDEENRENMKYLAGD